MMPAVDAPTSTTTSWRGSRRKAKIRCALSPGETSVTVCLVPWWIAVTNGPDAGSWVMSSGSAGYQARMAPS